MGLAQYDAAVFMVSLDEPEQNRAFAESLGTTQTLLSDESGESAPLSSALQRRRRRGTQRRRRRGAL